jgi:hypothetical protein
MREMKHQFIERTLKVWQQRTPRTLNTEDARQIAENAAGFFATLIEWETAEQRRPSQATNNHTSTDGHASEGLPG